MFDFFIQALKHVAASPGYRVFTVPLAGNLKRNPVWAPVLPSLKRRQKFHPLLALKQHLLHTNDVLRLYTALSIPGKILHKSSSSLDNSGDCGYQTLQKLNVVLIFQRSMLFSFQKIVLFHLVSFPW